MLIHKQISLDKTKLTDDFKNVLDSSKLADKVTDALLGSMDIPQKISIHVTAYCVVKHSSTGTEPIRCVSAGYHWHAYFVFGVAIAFMVISLSTLIRPMTRFRNADHCWSAWPWLWISFYIVFAILILLLGITAAISSLLREQLLSKLLTIETNLAIFSFLVAACICLLVALWVSHRYKMPLTRV